MTGSTTAGERSQVGPLPRILLVGTRDTVGWFDVVGRELKRRDRWADAENADAVLVLVGPQFATGLDDHPMRPLIATAMNDGRPVVPLLVDGATMPDVAELPADLAPLAHHHALELGSPGEARIVVARVVLRCATAPGRAKEPSSRPEWRPTVFLAYRRADTSHFARLLFDEFVARLGETHVFLDVGSQRAGDDYTTRIGDALRRATDIVVVIGSGFLYPETDGVTRLSDPDDLLRHEIRTGFDEGKRVHLVVLGRAEVPDAAELPDDLTRLTRIKSVHEVRSVNEIPEAVGAIIDGACRRDASRTRRFGGASNWSGQALARLKPPAAGTGSRATDYLAAARRHEVVRREHATSVAAEITAAGWSDVTPRRRAGEMMRLVHVATGRYRLEINLAEAHAWLEERIHSARRAWLPDWVTRESVPIPPGDLSLRNETRLPDKLVLIAVDPDEYLEHRGRYRLSRRHDPFRRPSVYAPVGKRSLERRVSINAVEEYQQTQREVRSRGGLTTMEFGGQLTIEADEEWGLDFCPNGALAVGVTGGVAVQGTDFESWELRTTWTTVQAVACARDGRLAAVSGRGDLNIWNPIGATLVERHHAFNGFDMRSKLRSYRSLGSLAWSTNGRFLAAGDDVAVWLYDTQRDEICHWRLPTATYSTDTHVGFLTGSGELIVTAGRDAMCVLGVPDLAPRRVIEGTSKHGHAIADHSDARLVGPPPGEVHQFAVAPDGSVIAVGCSDGQIALYDPATLERVATAAWFPPHQGVGGGEIDAVAFDSTGDRLAAAAVEFSHSNRLLVGRTDGLVPEFQSPLTIEGGQCTLAWAPSGTRVAARSRAGKILLFDLPGTCHEGRATGEPTVPHQSTSRPGKPDRPKDEGVGGPLRVVRIEKVELFAAACKHALVQFAVGRPPDRAAAGDTPMQSRDCRQASPSRTCRTMARRSSVRGQCSRACRGRLGSVLRGTRRIRQLVPVRPVRDFGAAWALSTHDPAEQAIDRARRPAHSRSGDRDRIPVLEGQKQQLDRWSGLRGAEAHAVQLRAFVVGAIDAAEAMASVASRLRPRRPGRR